MIYRLKYAKSESNFDTDFEHPTLQGDRFAFLITQGAALGYELLPLQGVWSLLAKVECKDTASERNESLLSNCRAQDIFCKDNKKTAYNCKE